MYYAKQTNINSNFNSFQFSFFFLFSFFFSTPSICCFFLNFLALNMDSDISENKAKRWKTNSERREKTNGMLKESSETEVPSHRPTNYLKSSYQYNNSANEIVPVLQNVVATVNLKCKLDLKAIALHARNAEYNPKRFAAVIMRIRDPKTTALIFASGKMVVTGAKSEVASRMASQRYSKIIQKLGFNCEFSDFKIQNIVSSCDLKFCIKLENLAYQHSNYCSYEPELFPGLIYRMVKPKIVFLIFVSGKIVLTGAKEREDIFKAFEEIYPVLAQHRKE
ncbi:hypothetical protein NUSPORA_02862 [Nucleospora cyclopteri]